MDFEEKYGFVPSSESEMYGFEYTIPEGFEAEIKNGKVIVRKKWSKDERIRKEIIDFLTDGIWNTTIIDRVRQSQRYAKWIAYLEKQKDEAQRQFNLGVQAGREEVMYEMEKEQNPAESISQLSVKSKGVYKICPHCKERMIRDDSKVYTSIPPQYGYNCPKCGAIEFDTVVYDNPEIEEQKPAEWSKEDEHRRQQAINALDRNGYYLLVDWLKSLRPQPHWKPSEAQMCALKYASTYVPDDEGTLAELYEQLKKL